MGNKETEIMEPCEDDHFLVRGGTGMSSRGVRSGIDNTYTVSQRLALSRHRDV